jgi:hypothetical protein
MNKNTNLYKIVNWFDTTEIWWSMLSANKNINAISILEKNFDLLSANENATHILEQNLNRVNWFGISKNKNIFELDLKFLRQRMNIIREEMMIKIYYPLRFERYINMGYDIADDQYINIIE